MSALDIECLTSPLARQLAREKRDLTSCDFFVMTTRVRPTPRNLRGPKTQWYNDSWVDAATTIKEK